VPRAVWSGSISFGLVTAPVRMYSAVAEDDIHFHLVHATDGGRIGYQKVCKAEDRPVPSEEIVRAYEWAPGELVELTDEDLAAADPEATRELRISDFVPREQIDPIYFERTYHLGPAEGGERVYALLARAMEDAGLAAIGTFVWHDKEHLAALRVHDGVILLERMYFAAEVRDPEGIRPEGRQAQVDEGELDMARRLIAAYAGTFDPGRYRDRYRERVMGVIEAKRTGTAPRAAAPSRPDAPPDLLEALRASLAAADGRGSDRGGDRRRADDPEDLASLTVDELRARAREREISGYSKLRKSDLVEALAKAS